MSNYGDFVVDFDSSKKQNFKHMHVKIDCEITERKNAMDCMTESITDLKKQLHEEIHFRKLLIKLFASVDCENTENRIILAQQIQINELQDNLYKVADCLQKSNEYINDLYWALFHDKPAIISPVIAPPSPPEPMCIEPEPICVPVPPPPRHNHRCCN
jgi:hypothetical protein